MDNVGCTPQKDSPIEMAKDRLRNIIGETKEIMNGFEAKLSSVITQPGPPSPEKAKEAKTALQTPLEEFLTAMITDMIDINNYLVSVQNRTQL